MSLFRRFRSAKIPALFITILALASTALVTTHLVLANGHEDVDDEGRSYSTYLNGSNLNDEFVVVGVGSYYDPSVDSGVARIRAWSRLENVRDRYPGSLGYAVSVSKAVVRLLSGEARRDYLFINGVNPPNATSSTTLALAIYDILGYGGVPTNLIEAYVNNFVVSSLTTAGFGSYDVQRTFSGSLSEAKIDLPTSIPYYDADAQVESQTSGSSAQSHLKYDFTYPGNRQDLWLIGRAKIQYKFTQWGSFPWFWWTGEASVTHQVNES